MAHPGGRKPKLTQAHLDFIAAHPELSTDELVDVLGVGRATVDRARKKNAAGIPQSMPAQALPPVVVVPEDPEGRKNWLQTEDGKNALAEMLGGKLKMTIDAMTPEKAARTGFKDLAIAAGVLTDKLSKINDDTAAGVGMLAVALVKAVSSQMKTLRALAPPTPVDVEAEVVAE
jgi:hypothetical protein